MFVATREKTRLWLLILVGVVATLLGQTHAREIFAPLSSASGEITAPTPASTGDFYDADRYDVPDSLLAARGTAATYEIVDGVRRSTAAYSTGATTIPAQVMADGKIIQTLDVTLDALRSPKPVIDVSTPSSLSRWQQTLQKTQGGSTPPPIIIQQGSRGTPIPNIGFDHVGGGW